MNGRPDDAFFYLRSGEFEKAKKIFSLHLDKDPTSSEWIEGYYVSSYWDNKLDHLLSLREGKERGKALLQYLQTFESEVITRKLPRLQSYQECIQCVLEETTRNLGIAFRLEGWNGLERETVWGLASCHIRLNHFDKALEILNLTGGERFQSTEHIFLKADCLIGLDRKKDGIPLYILGFMDDPLKLPIGSIQWRPVLDAHKKARSGKWGDSLPYLLTPIILLKEGTWDEWIHLRDEEFRYFHDLATRIQKGIENQSGDYRMRGVLRLGFIAEVLIRSRRERDFPLETGEMKSLLQEIRREINDLIPE